MLVFSDYQILLEACSINVLFFKTFMLFHFVSTWCKPYIKIIICFPPGLQLPTMCTAEYLIHSFTSNIKMFWPISEVFISTFYTINVVDTLYIGIIRSPVCICMYFNSAARWLVQWHDFDYPFIANSGCFCFDHLCCQHFQLPVVFHTNELAKHQRIIILTEVGASQLTAQSVNISRAYVVFSVPGGGCR